MNFFECAKGSMPAPRRQKCIIHIKGQLGLVKIFTEGFDIIQVLVGRKRVPKIFLPIGITASLVKGMPNLETWTQGPE